MLEAHPNYIERDKQHTNICIKFSEPGHVMECWERGRLTLKHWLVAEEHIFSIIRVLSTYSTLFQSGMSHGSHRHSHSSTAPGENIIPHQNSSLAELVKATGNLITSRSSVIPREQGEGERPGNETSIMSCGLKVIQ